MLLEGLWGHFVNLLNQRKSGFLFLAIPWKSRDVAIESRDKGGRQMPSTTRVARVFKQKIMEQRDSVSRPCPQRHPSPACVPPPAQRIMGVKVHKLTQVVKMALGWGWQGQQQLMDFNTSPSVFFTWGLENCSPCLRSGTHSLDSAGTPDHTSEEVKP